MECDITSIQRRLRVLEVRPETARERLAPLAGGTAPTEPEISVVGYLYLARWSAGYNCRTASVELQVPEVLVLIVGSPERWAGCVARVERVFGYAVGSATAGRDFAAATWRQVVRWI